MLTPVRVTVLQGEDVADEHCVIEHEGGTVTLLPLRDAPCTVNGQQVSDPVKLTQGQSSRRLRYGDVQFDVHLTTAV